MKQVSSRFRLVLCLVVPRASSQCPFTKEIVCFSNAPIFKNWFSQKIISLSNEQSSGKAYQCIIPNGILDSDSLLLGPDAYTDSCATFGYFFSGKKLSLREKHKFPVAFPAVLRNAGEERWALMFNGYSRGDVIYRDDGIILFNLAKPSLGVPKSQLEDFLSATGTIRFYIESNEISFDVNPKNIHVTNERWEIGAELMESMHIMFLKTVQGTFQVLLAGKNVKYIF
ncbi:unnamed protein product [Albugo candida]|uniref:Altered inheritance of mitochondria protein 24, mitochondrial n=1 Tax=Albugo candida TaxID=65357 RepID=A0A024GBM1_9STRA|nr:unnamed protein product [Albugo candida]|eukprot:CCI43895.1 unnamed protein product [Albugo candida]